MKKLFLMIIVMSGINNLYSKTINLATLPGGATYEIKIGSGELITPLEIYLEVVGKKSHWIKDVNPDDIIKMGPTDCIRAISATENNGKGKKGLFAFINKEKEKKYEQDVKEGNFKNEAERKKAVQGIFECNLRKNKVVTVTSVGSKLEVDAKTKS